MNSTNIREQFFMPIFRLDKIISDTGVSSRRGAKQLIRSGRVRVNGNIASSFDDKFNSRSDRAFY